MDLSEPRRIYVASAWRNPRQHLVVAALRGAGHEVYDFKQPTPGANGFHWSEIDPSWTGWSADSFREALQHPVAQAGFASDFGAMEWADTGVMVMPCGRSAHLEAGYFVGAHKPLYILLDAQQEPELMYSMATALCVEMYELVDLLGIYHGEPLVSEIGA